MTGYLGRARLALAAVAAVALAGCVTVDRFADRGLAYNVQIASAQDRMLFLNIVRAAYRRPMAFTSIAAVTGSATASGTLGFNLPFAGAPNLLPYQAAPSLSASGGPTFTVNNLDSQEFMKGFLAPVTTATINLFGQEGLPWQELYDLMIAEATVTDDAGRTVLLLNRPGQEADFQGFIAALRDADVRTEEVDGVEAIGPPLAAGDAKSVEAASPAAAQANFHLARLDDGRFQLQRTNVSYRFCVGRPDAAAIAFSTADGARHVIGVTAPMRCGQAGEGRPAPSAGEPKALAASRLMLGSARPKAPAGDRVLAPAGIEATFRSAEGVTYFLGEIVRQQLCLEADEDCREPPIAVGGGPGWPAQTLLRVERGAGRAGDVADIAYLGQAFRLRGGANDRSAQVLTILGELVNLNKSAKDNPAPSVVTLVGH